ncbi:MAG: 3-deoxy-8-phosphooctulonate synthase [Deltaproteobacteria bacterium]|nr:3-deoxy-8-phosphooctulonate synthase [Deltaproteobacteria bacterium]
MVAQSQIGPYTAGRGHPLVLIAGPCVIEGEEITLRAARRVAELSQKHGLPAVFKCSFDKANRTSGKSFRGPGIDEGLRVLKKVKEEGRLPVLTDVHELDHCAKAAEVVDVLQIPAFLCRQTDLLFAAGKTGRAVNVKKGQFVAPEDMKNAVDKLAEVGCENVLLTERGSSFGYHNLVVDMRGLLTMRGFAPVCFDATHSVQRPGAGPGGTTTGGDRTLAPHLARAAAAIGIDALFCEVHEDPDKARSDGPNSLTYPMWDELLGDLVRLRAALPGKA